MSGISLNSPTPCGRSLKNHKHPIHIGLLCPRPYRNECSIHSPDESWFLLRTAHWKSGFESQHSWVLGLGSSSRAAPPCVVRIHGVQVFRENAQHLLGSHESHACDLSLILDDNTDGAIAGNNHTCNFSLGL